MALQHSAMVLASAAMAISHVAAYAVVDVNSLAMSDFKAPPVVNAAATTAADGYIHFDVVHSTNSEHFGKRAAVELSLTNHSDIAYYAKLNFGTPAQPQYVQLDTGSFELWVNPSCSGLASSDKAFCKSLGSYDASASATSEALASGKTLRYGIGSANITYVRDTISLGDNDTTVLTDVQFGVATSSVDEFSGILGIGYGLNLTTRYRNFVDELASQGVTQVKAFSIALGSKAEQQGVITFGGVDTSKFAGTLAQLPITPARSSPDGVPRYWVNMTSMSLTDGSGTSTPYKNSTMQVFLDSGSTLTLLPPDIVSAMAADFNATGPTTDGFYLVDCALLDQPGSVDFAFSGVTISVKFSELLRQSGNQCALGLQPSDSFALLGDTFMRSAYVVIDQTSDSVWMAPYVNCGSTPSALQSESSLASLSGACAVTAHIDNNSNSGSSSSAASATSAAAKSSTTASATATSSATGTAATAAASTSSAQTSSASPTRSSGAALFFSLFATAVLSYWLQL